MAQHWDVDVDAEKTMFDGAWLDRHQLSAHITQMMAAGDFKIGRLAEALEALDQALAGARVVTLRLAGEDYAKLEAAGQKLGKTAAGFARDLLTQVLGSVSAAPPSIVPAGPQGEAVSGAPLALGSPRGGDRHSRTL